MKRLNDLKDKTIQRSLETEKLIIDLNDDGIEILKSAEDKDAVVWIWCKSAIALQKLKETNGFENIAQIFCQLTEKNAQLRFEKNINIDHDQLEKTTGRPKFVKQYELPLSSSKPLSICLISMCNNSKKIGILLISIDAVDITWLSTFSKFEYMSCKPIGRS